MFKIIVESKDGYEDNYYNKHYEVEVHNDTNIHSYVNAFLSALEVEGFLLSTIKNGLDAGIADIEEEVDVYRSH